MLIFPILYFLTPYTTLIQDATSRYAVFLGIMFVKGFVVIVAFPCTTILLTNSASSLRILGTLNGFATTFSGLGRAIGPACVGAVFSWGVEEGYVIAPWWLLGLIASLGAIPPFFIIDGEGPSRGAGTDDEEEGEAESLLGNENGSGDCHDDNVAVLDAFDELDSDSGSDGLLKRGSKSYGTTNGVSRR